jgi:hypothetical protein
MRLFAYATALAISLLVAAPAHAQATDLKALLPSLKSGGYVLVFRHTATDAAQEDVFPFDYSDMSKQRQLSEEGRKTAQQLGAALAALGIPIGEVWTSRLNRAIETGQMLAGKPGTGIDALTDSSSGKAGGMANAAGGGSEALGAALRKMASTRPAAGTNTVVVTHKTNIIDAFGEDWAKVKEGEVGIFKPDAAGALVPVARVQAVDWLQMADQ